MAYFSDADAVAALVRDGSTSPPTDPYLWAEANRAVRLYLRRQTLTDAQIGALTDEADVAAQLRRAEACKVLALHYQGMQEDAMLARAEYWDGQYAAALALLPEASTTGELPSAGFSSSEVRFG